MNYCDKSELKNLLKEYQTTGILSEELIKLLNKIIVGITWRYGRGDLDHQQNAWLKIIKVLPKIKIDGNCFGWLTSVILNEIRATRRGKKQVETISLTNLPNVSRR